MNNAESSKTLITTSRNPTQAVRTFSNDLIRSIPNSVRINRGKSSLDSLAEKALEYGAQKVMISDRWKGGIGKIQLFEVGNTGLLQFYPSIYVKEVKLRRAFGHARKVVKSRVIQTEAEVPFETHRLANAFSHFLNIPKLSIDETLPPDTQATMHISLNPACCTQITFLQIPQRIEIGPRITVSHLVWKPRK